MSFGGLIHYGMKYAQRIHSSSEPTKAKPAPKETPMVHPCPACCHVSACRNVECGAHPTNRDTP